MAAAACYTRDVRALVLSVALVLGLSSFAAADVAPERDEVTQPSGKPSGFWGSGQHVSNADAYRWRLLAIGGVLVVGTGVFMIRLVRKANRENRERRPS